MSFFDRIERAIENFEVRQEIRQEERFLAEERWEMEGAMFDPYMHGDIFYDPFLSAHGVMYNGMWHPLEYGNGGWMFTHPARYNMPRYYQPQSLMPAQMPGYPGGSQGGYAQSGYNNVQQPMPSQYQQPQGGYGQGEQQGYRAMPQIGTISCPRCQTANASGTHFCTTCGNDLQAQSAVRAATGLHCTACGTALPPGAHFCANCGHKQ